MKKYYFEAVCSFFVVGLGQILKGEGEKGLQLILTIYFILPAICLLSLFISGYFFVLTLGGSVIIGIVLWVHSIWDALMKNEQII